MPLGFSGGNTLIGLQKSFGDTSAHMLMQTGKQIEQNLQKMQTSRQVQALGAELSNLNPQSPDWTQQATAIGARLPLAMQSEAGQFLLGTQAKAHHEWAAAQRAQQQANQTFGRQIALENLRTENDIKLEGIRGKNRIGAGIDLSDVNLDLPERANPAANVGTSVLSGGASNIAQEEDEPIPMTGLRGGMRDVARTVLGEIQEEQRLAPGLKYTPTQINSRINSTLSRENQRIQQEDRQTETRIGQEERALTQKERDQAVQQRADVKMEVSKVSKKLSVIRSRIADSERDLASFIKGNAEAEKKYDEKHDPYYKLKAEKQAALQKLGEEETSLLGSLDSIGGENADEGSGIVKVKSRADAEKLPTGSKFQTPDGRILIR